MSTSIVGIQVKGDVKQGFEKVLTPEALQFLEKLEKTFGEQRTKLLHNREERQLRLNQDEQLNFLSETEAIRNSNWTIAPLPRDLQDRRVEITGPVDRKMVINALNSGASCFMACFEDATSPTWENIMDGQVNLKDSVKGTISFESESGKKYQLNENPAVLIVRPRGLHLVEKHVVVDGNPISASLFDYGLYFFHNYQKLLEKGSAPYFYLPKLESHHEARWWNEVFEFSQKYVGIPRGTIKATVLIETITAAFEMDEILYELREHSGGLNCGRWDYIFSYIKKLRERKNVILPDRSLVTMTVPFMRAYSLLTIRTCHRRGAPAIGGMAAQIPIKHDSKKNEEALQKVRLDKEREAKDGHDGTWVAHPGLVPIALEVFDREMPQPNQIDTKRLDELVVQPEQLLEVPTGFITEQGVRTNISVGIQYLSSWLCGQGAAPIHNLMEDVATAEISRAQLWQWIRHPKGILEDGRKVNLALYESLKLEEMDHLRSEIGESRFHERRFSEAIELFDQMIHSDEFVEFLTIPGYEKLI